MISTRENKLASNCSYPITIILAISAALIWFSPSLECAEADERIDLTEAYRGYATSLASEDDLQPLIDAAGDRRLALLGESTHGTSEYYTWRAAISKRLIEEKGFSFIVVEGDWISISRLNRYAKHMPDAAESAREALLELDQWPHWMWANEEFAELGEWLHEFNRDRPDDERVGVYGMDVYAPWNAMDAVMEFYREFHPDKKQTVRDYYAEFERYRDRIQEYAIASSRISEDVQTDLKAAFDKTERLWSQTEGDERFAAFFAKQSARVAKGAERFYSTMGRGGPDSWNHRVAHMTTTVDRLLAFYGDDSRGIVWAHNTHIGDARATDMANAGQYNIGHLSRAIYGEDSVYLVGFSTYEGEVLAARQWEGQMETMSVPPARDDSFDAALKSMAIGDALLLFPYTIELVDEMPELHRRALGHRAIGVIFQPEMERERNYVPTLPVLRYDALIYLDETTTLAPLHDRK